MSDREPPRSPELYGGSVLGPDGKLERGPGASPSPGASSGVAPDGAEATPPEPPLELQERPPRPETEPLFASNASAAFATPTPPKRRGIWWMALLIAAAVLAGIALDRGFRFGREGELPVVVIDSEPSGAQVRIDGEAKGSTPLLFQNRYPARAIPVELRAPGFKRWKGTFRGGQEVRLDIKLEQERR